MTKRSTVQQKTYAEKLLDPRWQRKRLEVLARYEWMCGVCYDSEATLNVHHKMYIRGREPWEYDHNQLVALCNRCHKQMHEEGPGILADVCSRLPVDGPYCDRDVGIVLAALFFPDLKTEDEFASRCIRELKESGAIEELHCEWDRVYWGAVQRIAEKESGKK